VIPPIVEALDALTITPVDADYVLKLGALGDDAVLIGAMWLALERRRVDYLLGRADAPLEQPAAAATAALDD